MKDEINHQNLIAKKRAILDAINEPKISGHDLLEEILTASESLFYARFDLEEDFLHISLLNGQKFRLTIEEE